MSEHTVIYKENHNELEDLYYQQYKGITKVFTYASFLEYKLYKGLLSKEECTNGFMLWAVKCFGSSSLPKFLKIKNEDEIPDFIKIAAIQKDNYGGTLGCLKNPSEDVVNASLGFAGQSIVYVPTPTEQQKLVAFGTSIETPWLIAKVKKPTFEMQKEHVMRYGAVALQYIKKPSEKIKIIAAKSDGVLALKYIKRPSEQVILAAISATWGIREFKWFLRYIPNPNYKISCAIRHQIKLDKEVFKESAPEQEICFENCVGTELEWLFESCCDPIAAAKIRNQYQSDQDKIKALNEYIEKNNKRKIAAFEIAGERIIN